MENLPELPPDLKKMEEEMRQARSEQPVMNLEELRAQTPSWRAANSQGRAEVSRSTAE
jgi:hypothetical protein